MPAASFILRLCIFLVSILTVRLPCSLAALQIPPCPPESQRFYSPDSNRPVWTGCKDKNGLYQGLLIQFSNQTEIIRIAGVQNSLRHGTEIRFGAHSTLEERHYRNGHLDLTSLIFKSESLLGRILPKNLTSQDWKNFNDPSAPSFLRAWLGQEPNSKIEFQNGRLKSVATKTKKFDFEQKPDGRIFSLNHPEMKGVPLIDPEALWILSPDDLKRALLPGFGSCKQYSAPIGRFTRNYDSLLFRRESSEKRHLLKLNKMRERFAEFCFPEDLKVALGKLECPPALPSDRPPRECLFAFSDQLRIPYQPQYFRHDFTLKKSPEDFVAHLNGLGFQKFLSNHAQDLDFLTSPDQKNIEVKKTARGILFRIAEKEKKGEPGMKTVNWWDWHEVPGY